MSLAAPRLRREGVPLARGCNRIPEDRLYALLCESAGDLAHARYTACLRQIASFADACRRARRGWRLNVRTSLDRDGLRALMQELARSARGPQSQPGLPRRRRHRRSRGLAAPPPSTPDLHSDRDEVFRDIQQIKERLQLNVEFARRGGFRAAIGRQRSAARIHPDGRQGQLLPLRPVRPDAVKGGSGGSHETSRTRGSFLASGMVDCGRRFRSLVQEIPSAAYARISRVVARGCAGKPSRTSCPAPDEEGVTSWNRSASYGATSAGASGW